MPSVHVDVNGMLKLYWFTEYFLYFHFAIRTGEDPALESKQLQAQRVYC